jgi:protein arginine N-methyltransferase 5
MFQAVNILSGQGADDGGRCGPQIQECWEFEHPRRDVVLDERGKYFPLSELRRGETSPCPDAFTCFSQGYQ